MARFFDSLKAAILVASYWGFRLFDRRRRGTISWVVGVEEIASVVRHLSDSIPGSHSVSFVPHPFYDHRYDSEPRMAAGSRFSGIERLVLRPILLAKLMNRAVGFIYVGRMGFLGSSGGSREFEFRFLKRHGLALCCYFTGNDIRAPRLLHELEKQTGISNIASNLGETALSYDSDGYDRAKRKIAAEADAWADVIFTAAVDQLSYLARPTEPFLYFFPDERFIEQTHKFVDIERPVVLHAPSSQLVKGTQLVRDAVQRLRELGYEFEYVELSGVRHSVVASELARAHIVLNQFYAFMPGVFGIEGLASRCAVLMSADATIESDLPPGANDAWMVTRRDQVFDHLKRLLDHPDEIETLAAAGYDWAKKYASASASGVRLSRILNAVLAGSYSGRVPW